MTDEERKRLATLEAQMAFSKVLWEKQVVKNAVLDRLALDNLKAHKELNEVIQATDAELQAAGLTPEEVAQAFEAAAQAIRDG
jgi:hypothetical protein